MSNSIKDKFSQNSVRLVNIASRPDVPRATVAKVMLGSGGNSVRVREQTCERVQEIARNMGYTLNRTTHQLKRISSQTFGFILDAENKPVMIKAKALMTTCVGLLTQSISATIQEDQSVRTVPRRLVVSQWS